MSHGGVSANARAAPPVAVITFPGSQDDRDAALALGNLGAHAVPVWHAEEELPDVGAVVLPAGSPTATICGPGNRALLAGDGGGCPFAGDGGLVLGICNGFQILCEAGLLPGVLRGNMSLAFVCRDIPVRVERTDTAFTSRCAAGQRLAIPVKHGEGCWFADEELLAELEQNGQILLRYDGDNPNGSLAGVAGVINREGNVMGLMPHPEHAVDPLLGSADGAFILESMLDARSRARGRLGPPNLLEPERGRELGMLPERLAQPLEVTCPQRDGPAPLATRWSSRRSGRAVRLPSPRAARTLDAKRLSPARCATRHLFDHGRLAPRGRRCLRVRHAATLTGNDARV